jgi:DNA-binding transcriptional MerR regulator
MKEVKVTIRLYLPEDEDILAWLKGLPKQGRVQNKEIKEAIRRYMKPREKRMEIDPDMLRGMVLKILRELAPNLSSLRPGGGETEEASKLIEDLLEEWTA